MNGKMSNGDQICETHVRFRYINDYECYINSIDEEYDAKDAIFSGYIYKKSKLLISIQLKEVDMVTVVILNMKLLKIEVIIFTLQQIVVVPLNSLIS